MSIGRPALPGGHEEQPRNKGMLLVRLSGEELENFHPGPQLHLKPERYIKPFWLGAWNSNDFCHIISVFIYNLRQRSVFYSIIQNIVPFIVLPDVRPVGPCDQAMVQGTVHTRVCGVRVEESQLFCKSLEIYHYMVYV